MGRHNTFVIGDIHGNIRALEQCLYRSQFDFQNDTLIVLGDVADGYKYVNDCVTLLLKVKNLINIRGNHDQWFCDYIEKGLTPRVWLEQGGMETLYSYRDGGIYPEHQEFFNKQVYYHIQDNNLFVHGGIPEQERVFIPTKWDSTELMWDRSLVQDARIAEKIMKKCGKITRYDTIYTGHTTTQIYNSLIPLNFCNVWMMDTGAGWDGRLSIMNIDNNRIYLSDLNSELYNVGESVLR